MSAVVVAQSDVNVDEEPESNENENHLKHPSTTGRIHSQSATMLAVCVSDKRVGILHGTFKAQLPSITGSMISIISTSLVLISIVFGLLTVALLRTALRAVRNALFKPNARFKLFCVSMTRV